MTLATVIFLFLLAIGTSSWLYVVRAIRTGSAGPDADWKLDEWPRCLRCGEIREFGHRCRDAK